MSSLQLTAIEVDSFERPRLALRDSDQNMKLPDENTAAWHDRKLISTFAFQFRLFVAGIAKRRKLSSPCRRWKKRMWKSCLSKYSAGMAAPNRCWSTRTWSAITWWSCWLTSTICPSLLDGGWSSTSPTCTWVRTRTEYFILLNYCFVFCFFFFVCVCVWFGFFYVHKRVRAKPAHRSRS